MEKIFSMTRQEQIMAIHFHFLSYMCLSEPAPRHLREGETVEGPIPVELSDSMRFIWIYIGDSTNLGICLVLLVCLLSVLCCYEFFCHLTHFHPIDTIHNLLT